MIRFSKEKLEEENSIAVIYFKVKNELDARRKLYEEFRQKITDEEIASLSDEKIKLPLARYLAVMCVGYFAGKAPIYKIKAYDKEIDKLSQDLFDSKPNDEQKVKEMEYILKHVTDYNDDANEYFSLAFDYFVKRACYEILYKNKYGELVYSKSDALETAAIWDYSMPKNLIGLYRIIETTLANGEYQTMVELTTINGKRFYNATSEKIKLFGTPSYIEKYKDEPLFLEDKERKENKKWDDIQVVAMENEHNLNVFECVLSLINAYREVIQNSRNTFKYNDEAKLKIVGYKPENPKVITKNGIPTINPKRIKEDEYNLQTKVFYIENDTGAGDVDWLIKNLNDNALQNHKKTLMDLICLCSFVPNMTDLGFTQADNNSALEKKFFALQQLVTDAESDFKMGLTRRWELIFNKFNKDKKKEYDFRNIEITLQKNMPSDKGAIVEMLNKMADHISEETYLSEVPINIDPKNEIAKKKAESQDNVEENQEIIKKFNKNNPQEDLSQEKGTKTQDKKTQDDNENQTIDKNINKLIENDK